MKKFRKKKFRKFRKFGALPLSAALVLWFGIGGGMSHATPPPLDGPEACATGLSPQARTVSIETAVLGPSMKLLHDGLKGLLEEAGLKITDFHKTLETPFKILGAQLTHTLHDRDRFENVAELQVSVSFLQNAFTAAWQEIEFQRRAGKRLIDAKITATYGNGRVSEITLVFGTPKAPPAGP